MQKATQLTRDGHLQAATAAIQEALGLSTASSPGPHANRAALFPSGTADWAPQVGAGDVIDIDAVTVDAVPDRKGAISAPAQPPLRGGHEQFMSGSHTTAQGQRDYKLYVPPQAATASAPLPMVVMLHGCTQTADDFAAGTAMNAAARKRGFFVLYPQQSAQANPQRCWNWFKHNHQTRDRGEPALLAGMVRAVMAEHAVDADRVWVAGLSAGGAMAAILAQAYPDIFAAAGVHSGLAAGAADDLVSAMAAMRQGASGGSSPAGSAVPTIVFHGDADTTVHPINGLQAFEAAGAPGAPKTGTADAAESAAVKVSQPGRRGATRRTSPAASGGGIHSEHWLVHGSPHAWSGGSKQGSYTDPKGPDATSEMLRFFFEHPRSLRGASAGS